MFRKIFNKRKSKSGSTAVATARVQVLTDKAAMKIAMVIHRMQNAFANFLNEQTKRFTGRTWKILILIFGACWGLFSVYVFSTALLHPAETVRRSVPKTSVHSFNAVPKRNDSLLLMEKIYEERKSIKK